MESSSRGRSEREGERIRSGLPAVGTDVDMGLELTSCEIVTGAEVKRLTA